MINIDRASIFENGVTVVTDFGKFIYSSMANTTIYCKLPLFNLFQSLYNVHMNRRVLIVLICIFLLAAILRLYNLSNVPPSPFLDEVSNGYNAYSLMLTGNDEYGKHLPLLLQAYNDFRPALFVYTLIPFIKILGLTVFAIRFPAVILSILSILCMYFLTQELLIYAYSEKVKREQISIISLLAMFLFAISPWDIFSARVSVEINMSLAYFIFGTTTFFYSLNKRNNKKLSNLAFYGSVILYTIAFYAYHGIKVFLPFFAVGLALIFYQDLFKRKKEVLVSSIIVIILLLPLIIAFMKPGATVRFWAVNNYVQQTGIISQSAQRILFDKTHHDSIGEIIDNRRVLLSMNVVVSYLKNFDPEWLFMEQAGSKSYTVPDVGPFYLFELPLFLLGIYFLIRENNFSKKIKLLLLIWILASAIPSGISTESPQLNRMNTMLPGFILIIAFGLYTLLQEVNKLANKNIKNISFTLVAAIIGLSFIWFVHAYFVEYPYLESESYQYGIIQAFTYANAHQNEYQNIVVSNEDEFLESYMYYLFTTKYNPKMYQEAGGTHSAFFTDMHVIGKYDFRNPNLYTAQTMKAKKKGQTILYLVNPGEINYVLIKTEHLKVIQKYQYLDGSNAIFIYAGTI